MLTALPIDFNLANIMSGIWIRTPPVMFSKKPSAMGLEEGTVRCSKSPWRSLYVISA